MRATLHTSGSVMAALGQKRDTTIPFTVEGTASEPVFRPDVKAIAGENAKGAVDSLLKGSLKKN
jgi:hypothetical protein